MSNNLDDLASMEFEQIVIGSLLQNGTRYDELTELIKENDFFYAKNRVVYSEMVKLAEAGEPIDLFLIGETLPDSLDYMADLAANVVSGPNLKSYATVIRDKAIKRNIAAAGSVIYSNALNPDVGAAESIEFAQSAVMKLEDAQSEELDVVHVNQAMKFMIDEIDRRFRDGNKINGLATGLAALDARVKGYKPKNLVFIAGRPGMAKTTIALQMALHAWCNENKNGLFFSVEMSVPELMEKALACMGRIPLDSIQTPNDQFFGQFSEQMHVAASKLKDKQMNIIDCPGIHINQIKSYVRKAHKRKKLDFIVADHFHIITGDGRSPVERFTHVSGGLKQLAKELDIVVVALAQLNRSVEARPNKRPLISDLRDSGSIEQDADIIHLLYREDYYKQNENEVCPNDGLLEINTAKFRNGKRGTDYFQHKLYESRIEDTDRYPVFEQDSVKSIRNRL